MVEAAHAAHPPRSARAALAPLAKSYEEDALRYYLMRFDGLSCDASRDVVRELRK